MIVRRGERMEERVSKPSLFISHSHSDWRLAKRLQSLLESMGFDVNQSSDDGAIKSGENWRDWIDDKVLKCDVAIVLLTPGTFRGRWVLWEAGAVAGVQYERLKNGDVSSGDPSVRRVRGLQFRLDNADLGPFGSTQARSGLNSGHIVSFFEELLIEFQNRLDANAFRKSYRELTQTAEKFVDSALADLRYTPIHADEGIVQDWLARLDTAREEGNDRWLVASKRWINV